LYFIYKSGSTSSVRIILNEGQVFSLANQLVLSKYIFIVAQQSLVGQGLHIVEASR